MLPLTVRQQRARIEHTPWERPVKDWPWAELLPAKRTPTQLSLADFRQTFTRFEDAAAAGVTWARFADVPPALQQQIAETIGAQPPRHKIDQWFQIASPHQFVIAVPPNVSIDLQWTNRLTTFWPVLFFIVGEGANLTLHESRENQPAFGSTSVALICDKGSRVHYLLTDRRGGSYQTSYAAYAGTHSQVSVSLAAKLTGHQHLTATIHHTGWNTQGKIQTLLAAQGDARSYVSLMNNHLQQRGRGDIRCAALGQDRSHVQIDGWISIGLKAKGTISTLHEDALLLSQESRVKTIPNLEILNNDVQAFHAATVGRLSAAELYYLMSRGLSETQARRLLVRGFAQRVSRGITQPTIKQIFEQFLKST